MSDEFQPTAAGERPTLDARSAPSAGGGVVGRYRLLHKIGGGGMGEVWLAEQSEPVRRQVALKVIRSGMDSEQIIDRFESERQALALMDHPAIATVFDGGTAPDGRPFFAMEYVKGEPITTYCDRHRLGNADRLRLFMRVCEGVQHAHQKGIIHRDLKPSNVLIAIQDGHPVPKIIDFGVAKATAQQLTERKLYTEMGVLVGTPEYMSPEQAEMGGLDVDTRTDVYSLGVLLYELLTGVLPFSSESLRRGGYAEIQRIIREQDPPRPSTRVGAPDTDPAAVARNRQSEPRRLASELRGDLDWITMRALEKDRTHRYPTANALAADIDRHLKDEPVSAGPPSGLYRARKLFRRHRAALVASAAVALALVAGVVGTTWGLLRARAEALEARRQTAIAEAVNEFLNTDLLAAAAPSTQKGRGKDVTMREVLAVASERLDADSRTGGRFANEPLVEAAIRTAIGNTYRELGEYPTAAPHLERALELRRRTLGDDDRQTLYAMNVLGLLRWNMNQPDRARPLFEDAAARARRKFGPESPDVLTFDMNVANVYRQEGRYKDAEPIYVRTLEISRRVLGPDTSITLKLASNLANLYQETGRYEKAEPLHRMVYETERRKYGERDLDAIGAANNLANDLGLMGRFDEAVPLTKRTLELKQEIYGPEHPSTLNSMNNMGELLDQLGQFREAEPYHRQTSTARARVLGPDHRRTLLSLNCLADNLVSQKRHAEAEPIAAAAAARATAVLGERDLDALLITDTRALALLGLGRTADAERLLRRTLAVLEDRQAKGEDVGESEGQADDVRAHLGLALARMRRWSEAESLLVTYVPKLPPREARSRQMMREVAEFYDAWNRAEPSAERATKAGEWRARAGS